VQRLARARGAAAQAVVSEPAWHEPRLRALAGWAARVVVVPAPLFAGISALDSPAQIGFVLDLPPAASVQAAAATVVLDRLQDPGNVGSVLRSAAAFGVAQVLALKGSVALWSPKVLRAAWERTSACGWPRAGRGRAGSAASAARGHQFTRRAGTAAGRLALALCWVLGHEGQGVSATLLARCALQVRIPQPGGEESLNVAAAAAVCLYESARQHAGALGAGSTARRQKG